MSDWCRHCGNHMDVDPPWVCPRCGVYRGVKRGDE